MDGNAGFFVATPFALAPPGLPDVPPDGAAARDWTRTASVIWVQRGWAPRHQQDRMRLPPVATPEGVVHVSGRLAPALSQRFALGADGGGAIRQNLAAAQMIAPFEQPVLSMVVVQTDAPSDGLLRNWPPPDLGADKNRGYAVQWFGMAALILVLYVWLQILRPILRRRNA
jgi:surfeit locus 1 family protein